MRHLAFYYAVFFAIVGCLMLGFAIFKSSVTTPNNFHVFSVLALALSMVVPFMVSGLCWLEYKRTRGVENGKREPEH